MAKVKQFIDRETGEKETLESLIRRFKKKVMDEGILIEYKKREYYKSKSVRRKEKDEESAKRNRKKK